MKAILEATSPGLSIASALVSESITMPDFPKYQGKINPRWMQVVEKQKNKHHHHQKKKMLMKSVGKSDSDQLFQFNLKEDIFNHWRNLVPLCQPIWCQIILL